MNKKKNANKKEAISRTQWLRWMLSAYIIVFLLCQLFTFEKFPVLLMNVGANKFTACAIVITLVLLELFSLPHLLHVKTNKIVEFLSTIAVFPALIMLGIIDIMISKLDKSSFFGATFAIPSSAWTLLTIAALFVLAVWASKDDLIKMYKDIFNKPAKKVQHNN